jgi:hypothetical protein
MHKLIVFTDYIKEFILSRVFALLFFWLTWDNYLGSPGLQMKTIEHNYVSDPVQVFDIYNGKHFLQTYSWREAVLTLMYIYT